MVILTEYDIGDIVYLRTDEDQLPRMVVAVRRTLDGTSYDLACGTRMTAHFSIELSRERLPNGVQPARDANEAAM